MNLTFGQAMRLGAMQIPERHMLYLQGPISDPCGACALGAALWAVGEREDIVSLECHVHDVVARHWPWAAVRGVAHPCGRQHSQGWTASAAAEHLFECCGYFREQVADWLDSIDPTLQVEPVEAPVAVTQI